MKSVMFFLALIALFNLAIHSSSAMAANNESGEQLYKKHCRACHPHTAPLKSTKSITDKIKNPLSFMPRFDDNKISPDDANKISDYIKQ
jgi:mono/diheme cytochrome c family protein